MLTVHHLQHSQSERILWLLEELQLPYKIVLHKRDPVTRLSPPDLKALHISGTAPVLIDESCSPPLTLPESSAIAHYILGKYAPTSNTIVVPPEATNYASYLHWLYFVLCSFQPAASTAMIAFLDSSLADNSLTRNFSRGRFERGLSIIEARLEEEGIQFLAGGDDVTLADIMCVWNMTTFRDFLPYSLEKYPNILAYVKRLTGREAYRRAWEKGEGSWEGYREAEPGNRKAVL